LKDGNLTKEAYMNDKPDFIKEAMSKNNIELKVWSVLMVLVFLFPPHV